LLDLVEVGDVNTGDAIARLNQRQAERARTQSEIKILEARRNAGKIEITPEAFAILIETWRGQFNEVEKANDPNALRSLLARFVVKIELGYRQARIWYTYPIDLNNTQEQSPDTGAQEPSQGGFLFDKTRVPRRGYYPLRGRCSYPHGGTGTVASLF
jgi:hypothetical protein